MRTSELIGTPLDWAVAKCEGWTYRYDFKYGHMYFPPKLYEEETIRWEPSPLNYSSSWSYGGPIIERELICIGPQAKHISGFMAFGYLGTHMQTGPTPLVAAMRCYVASKLGEEVEIPKELQQ